MTDNKPIKWTEEEEELVKELRRNNLVTEIYEVLVKNGFERTPEAISSKCKREGWYFEGRDDELDESEDTLNEKMSDKEDSLLKNLQDAWQEIVTVGPKVNPVDEDHGFLHKDDDKIRIVSISDLHIPFHKEDLLLEVLIENKGADYLVVNGDMLDLYAVSVFTKHHNVPLLKEYAIALEYIKVFSKLYKNVILLDGNHERRLHKYLSKSLSNNVVPMLSRPILERLANGEIYDDDGRLIGMTPFDNVHYSRHCAWMCQIGGAVFVHPEMFLGNSSTGVLRTVTKFDQKHRTQLDYECIVMAHCFDKETEILTDTGWKTIDSIDQKDQAMTLNLDSNELEFNKINSIHKYDNYDKLIKFSNSQTEIMVTPQHGMLAANRYSRTQKWEKINAENLLGKKRFDIPAAGYEKQIPDNKDFSDEKISLLGWTQAEGNIHFVSPKDDNGYHIRLSQSDTSDNYLEEIEKILEIEKISYSKKLKYKANAIEHGTHRNHDAYVYNISCKNAAWMKDAMNPDKTFKWDFITSLSYRQRQILIESICKGDGSKCSTENWQHFYTKNLKIRDQFQMLASMNGYKTNNGQRKDGTYIVYLSNRSNNIRTISNVEEVPYSGETWCLNVPNGTLMARRNGTMFITQNTHGLGQYVRDGVLLIEQGALCNSLEYEEEDPKGRYGLQTLGYAVIELDKQGHVDFNNSRPIYCGYNPKRLGRKIEIGK